MGSINLVADNIYQHNSGFDSRPVIKLSEALAYTCQRVANDHECVHLKLGHKRRIMVILSYFMQITVLVMGS